MYTIGHFAPFGPGRCGLYEAARDMVKADKMAGNEILFFDTGVIEGNKQNESQVGSRDNRNDFILECEDLSNINKLDLIIAHTGINDNWIVRNDCPIIWVVHGRPLASFRPEIQGRTTSFSLYENVSQWQRVKKMLYFWPEFTSYWKNVFPENKLCCFDYPPIDTNRYSPTGDKYEFKSKGKYNILLCDSMREDICNYEVVNGLIEAVRKYQGLKIHFAGSIDLPIDNAWNIILNKLKDLGGLGDILGRITNLETVYRSTDLVVSPNRIITRTIGEAISSNTPVLCQQGNSIGTYQCDIANTSDVVEAIGLFIKDKDNNVNMCKLSKLHGLLSLKNYSKNMEVIYSDLLRK